jgi:hypothetical protein
LIRLGIWNCCSIPKRDGQVSIANLGQQFLPNSICLILDTFALKIKAILVSFYSSIEDNRTINSSTSQGRSFNGPSPNAVFTQKNVPNLVGGVNHLEKYELNNGKDYPKYSIMVT